MSLGVVIALDSAVLFVADGRRSTTDSIVTDQAEKIVPLTETLAVIEFGAEIGSNAAVEHLKRSRATLTTGEQATAAVTSGVQGGSAMVCAMVIPGTMDMTRLQVGLVAGGIDEKGTFVCGALFGHGMPEPASQLVRPNSGELQFMMLGGEAVGSHDYFRALATRALDVCGSDANGLLNMLLKASKRTVHYAATLDKTIGGRVQYLILAKGRPPRHGNL
jgi:hypothetical protein